MNGIKESILLGIIQGATEFLPVSSSGHLVLIPALLNLPLPNLSFTMGLHLGTFFSLIVYFFKDILNLFKGFFSIFKKERSSEEVFNLKLLGFIIVAVIPASIFGVIFSEQVDILFSSPKTVSYLFLITAFFLFLASFLSNRSMRDLREINIKDAVSVGIFQIISLLPGVSRSGSTITGGVVSGLKQEDASKFSFLVAIPIILGSSVFEISGGTFGAFSATDLFVGFFVSFAAGLASLFVFFPLIRKTKFYIFAIYCLILSIFGILHFN